MLIRNIDVPAELFQKCPKVERFLKVRRHAHAEERPFDGRITLAREHNEGYVSR